MRCSYITTGAERCKGEATHEVFAFYVAGEQPALCDHHAHLFKLGVLSLRILSIPREDEQ